MKPRWELLLTDDAGTPIGEIGEDAAEGAPSVKDLFARPVMRGDRGADANALDIQGWAIIAPSGEEGTRRIKDLGKLIEHREAEQRSRVKEYRVGPGVKGEAALSWIRKHYSPEDVPKTEQPGYLLLLGDLHEISFDLQQALAHDAMVGRVYFPARTGYSQYAEKVVRVEQARRSEPPNMLLYGANDNTPATEHAQRYLLDKLAEMFADRRRAKTKTLDRPRGSDELLRIAGSSSSGTPPMLLSVCHGNPYRSLAPGAPPAPAGGLRLDAQTLLTPSDVANGSFLSGGLWLCIACFGAGTPAESSFKPWLELLLHSARYKTFAESALLQLRTQSEDRLSPLPLAALANPQGPVGILAHLDLAWTYSYTDPGDGFRSSWASRFMDVIEQWVRGRRAGVGMSALHTHYCKAADNLLRLEELKAWAARRQKSARIDEENRAHLWMLRNDLRGYLLLGDPAVRVLGTCP